jgi:hypothetical protein
MTKSLSLRIPKVGGDKVAKRDEFKVTDNRFYNVSGNVTQALLRKGDDHHVQRKHTSAPSGILYCFVQKMARHSVNSKILFA